METAGGITVTGHALKNADRLLIRPASGRQADTGLSARTNHWKDTATTTGHSRIESRTKSTERQPDKRPRRDNPHTHSSGMTPDGCESGFTSDRPDLALTDVGG